MGNSTPSVSIIILNWNDAMNTIECLNSVKNLSYPNYEIILIDNGSTDDSPKIIKKKFPDLEIIKVYPNRGFAGGCNVGVKEALNRKFDYMFLLSNDTAVNKNLLVKLVEIGESGKRIGIVGPRVYYYEEPKKIWGEGGKINFYTGRASHFNLDRIDNERNEKEREVDYIPGCGLLIKRKVIDEIGFLDEIFQCYYEEADWCIRAKRSGWQIVCVPRAKMWHKISVSFGGSHSPKVIYYMTRNRIKFIKKHANLFQKLYFFLYYSFRCVRSLGYYSFRQKDKKRFNAIYQGFIDGIKNEKNTHYL